MCHSLWAEKRHDGPCNSSTQVSQKGLSWNRATQYLQIIHFRLGFSISHPAFGGTPFMETPVSLRGLGYLAMVWYTPLNKKTTNWQAFYNICNTLDVLSWWLLMKNPDIMTFLQPRKIANGARLWFFWRPCFKMFQDGKTIFAQKKPCQDMPGMFSSDPTSMIDTPCRMEESYHSERCGA